MLLLSILMMLTCTSLQCHFLCIYSCAAAWTSFENRYHCLCAHPGRPSMQPVAAAAVSASAGIGLRGPIPMCHCRAGGAEAHRHAPDGAQLPFLVPQCVRPPAIHPRGSLTESYKYHTLRHPGLGHRPTWPYSLMAGGLL